MRCISLWQPWASLVALGLKRYETRHWSTGYRGPLAIHAAKRPVDPGELNATIIEALESMGYRGHGQLPFGCIVCTANLVGCEPTEQVKYRAWFQTIKQTELHFGDFTAGRWAWRLDNVQIVDNIPARGSQGFWEWTP